MNDQTAAALLFLAAGVCLAALATVLHRLGRWVLNGAAAAMVNDVGGDTRVSRVA